MTRTKWFTFGVLVAIAGAVLAQGGGVPSRLRILSLGLGTTAPTTNGDISSVTNRNATLQVALDNDSNGTGNASRLSLTSGDASSALFVAGSGRTSALITNGPTGAQSVLRTLGAYPLLFGTNNTLVGEFQGDGAMRLYGSGTVSGTSGVSLALPNAGAIRALDMGGTNMRHLISLWSDNVIYLGHASHELDILASSLQFNNVDVTPECSTINTNTGTGWSSMPTLAGSICRVGRQVSVTITAVATGTSNSSNTNFTNAIPVNFRPSSFTCAGQIGGTNNGVGEDNITIAIETSGTIAFSRVNNADCSSLGVNWTASGTKAISRGSFTYNK